MKRVLIVQASIKQYRKPFFEKLHLCLKHDNIELEVLYGEPRSSEKRKNDDVELPSDFGRKTRNYWIFNEKILIQPILKDVVRADLIIIEHASKHVINYFLLVASILRLKKVAFWGHGYNRQAKVKGLSEKVKRFALDKVDWWFTYTESTSRYLISCGFSPNRITYVNNSIDTNSLAEDISKVDIDAVVNARNAMGISSGSRLGVYCGGLYREKELFYLIEEALLVKKQIPEFELVVIGAGPDKSLVERAAEQHKWIHYLGPKFGMDKALWLSASELFLHPGALGLAVLDSFAAGIPLITTSVTTHGPEIDYLVNGHNGVISEFSTGKFAEAVIRLLTNSNELDNLKRGASESATVYSIDAMVERYKFGILKCLGAE